MTGDLCCSFICKNRLFRIANSTGSISVLFLWWVVLYNGPRLQPWPPFLVYHFKYACSNAAVAWNKPACWRFCKVFYCWDLKSVVKCCILHKPRHPGKGSEHLLCRVCHYVFFVLLHLAHHAVLACITDDLMTDVRSQKWNGLPVIVILSLYINNNIFSLIQKLTCKTISIIN